MIVCKFGGTSVEDDDALGRVAAIVESRLVEAPLVVVSALAGISDGLLAVLDGATAGRDAESGAALAAIAERHRAFGVDVEDTLTELDALRRGVLLVGDASPHVRARFVGAGELLSSRIVAARLGAVWFDAREVMRTAGQDPERDPPQPAEIALRAPERLLPLVASGRAVVTQGFIGADPSGRPTLLGRGGSDYSASLFGAALGAERIEIWTDVDGVLTANPQIVSGARRVRLLSFEEASELAYFGARVLHPATLLPAVERSIPVQVLNSRRPAGDGTTILQRGIVPAGDRWVVKAIADKRGIALVNVVSSRMLMAHGFLARIFGIFDEERTSVDLLATSEVSVSLTIDDDRRLQRIVAKLSEFSRVEVERGLGVVCLVGEGMRGRASIAADVFRAIRSSRVRLITQGASAINLSLVLPEEELEGALRALHETFFRGSLPAEIFGEAPRDRTAPTAPAGPPGALPGPRCGPSLCELADRYRTPLYVYDLDAVAERVAHLVEHLPRAPARAFYACKANSHPAILRLMKELGVGVECASPFEAERALDCGHRPEDVLLSATNARAEQLAGGLSRGVHVALGSRADVLRVAALVPGGEILLRVNPGVGDGHHAHVVTGGAHSKFGIPVRELPDALSEAAAAGLRVVGLHAHIGSGIVDPAPLLAAAQVLFRAAAAHESIQLLDLGGGFGVSYREGDGEIDLARWRDGVEELRAEFESRTGRGLALWVEPGRYLVAPCGWLVAEVVGRKESERLVFIGLDTGMGHFLRPALYGAYHRIANLTAPAAPEECVEIVGNVCETTDVFASNRPLPRTEAGHRLAILDAGAYGFAMASRYNLWPLPAEVAVRAGREVD